MNARKAIDERIKTLAPEAPADDLVKLAQAYSHAHYGPQGGAMDYRQKYDGVSVSASQDNDRMTYDYHSTPHKEQQAGPLGFRGA